MGVPFGRQEEGESDLGGWKRCIWSQHRERGVGRETGRIKIMDKRSGRLLGRSGGLSMYGSLWVDSQTVHSLLLPPLTPSPRTAEPYIAPWLNGNQFLTLWAAFPGCLVCGTSAQGLASVLWRWESLCCLWFPLWTRAIHLTSQRRTFLMDKMGYFKN